MTFYYILESGELTESKWEKQPGERHRDSKIKAEITKAEFDAVNKERVRRHNAQARAINKNASLWLAGSILEAAKSVGVDTIDALHVMKDLAPDSLNELKRAIK